MGANGSSPRPVSPAQQRHHRAQPRSAQSNHHQQPGLQHHQGSGQPHQGPKHPHKSPAPQRPDHHHKSPAPQRQANPHKSPAQQRQGHPHKSPAPQQPDQHGGQEHQHNQQPKAALNSANNGSHILIGSQPRSDSVFSGKYDNNVGDNTKLTVHTDIPRGSPAEHRQQQKPTITQWDSEDEEYLDVPTIIKSVPTLVTTDDCIGSTHNLAEAGSSQTIKQAKVNVKDRISKFTEEQDRRRQTAVAHDNNDYLQISDVLYQRRGSDASALKKPNKLVATPKMEIGRHTSRSTLRRGSEPAVLGDFELRIDNSLLPRPDYDDRRESEGLEEVDSMLPLPDYTGASKLNTSHKLTRVNTLEYFDQLTSQHEPLKGFEKAKPARVNKAKAHSPMPAQAYKARIQQQDSETRPKSMFITSSNGDTDLYIAGSQSTEDMESNSDQENGRKKLAGGKLAVGDVDPVIESKFLLSLKRNIDLRQARGRIITDNRRASRSLQSLVF